MEPAIDMWYGRGMSEFRPLVAICILYKDLCGELRVL